MFVVYVIKSGRTNSIYVGMTNNLQRRLREHDLGKNRTTRAYRPFQLIYAEEFTLRTDARMKEKYLKSGSGREWIKKNFARVAELVDAHV